MSETNSYACNRHLQRCIRCRFTEKDCPDFQLAHRPSSPGTTPQLLQWLCPASAAEESADFETLCCLSSMSILRTLRTHKHSYLSSSQRGPRTCKYDGTLPASAARSRQSVIAPTSKVLPRCSLPVDDSAVEVGRPYTLVSYSSVSEDGTSETGQSAQGADTGSSPGQQGHDPADAAAHQGDPQGEGEPPAGEGLQHAGMGVQEGPTSRSKMVPMLGVHATPRALRMGEAHNRYCLSEL